MALIPVELKPEQVTVVIDSREQLPYSFPQFHTTVGTLQSGDYSIRGLESQIAIERKGFEDFISCCGSERERFEREIERLLAYPTRAVLVECRWEDLERGAWRSKVTPQSIVGSSLGWIARGVSIVPCGNRERAELYCGRLLYISARRIWRQARALGMEVIQEATEC